MRLSAQFIKATDVARHLRRAFGKKASEAMLRDLSSLCERRIEQWAKGTHLKKVQTWTVHEDAERLKFGGKRETLRCWTCHKLKPEIIRNGDRCDGCKPRGIA